MSQEEKRTYTPNPMKVSDFAYSPVNIIIPFHGQYEKTSRLIQSIIGNVRSNPYQICLVDDGSDNKEYLNSFKEGIDLVGIKGFNYEININNQKFPLIVTVQHESQMGFGAALRSGFEATNFPWVMFLNSDCVVQDPNWMLRMGESLKNLSPKGVKMVSSKMNNPIGGDPRLRVTSANRSSTDTNDIILKKEDEPLPLHCVMCHRDLFKNIGGFIKSYPYYWYEDVELAYRMKKYGFLQGISGKSWIYHEGSATIKSLWQKDPSIRDVMDANRERAIKDMKTVR